MEGKSLVVGERYLLRVNRRQVPVRFVGRQERSQPGLKPRWLQFENLSETGSYFKLKASALSRHYDDCLLGACDCAARLAREVEL